MADKTGIEWTDASWNPVTGCNKVSAGCKNCYALRDWPRLSANPASIYFSREFTDVRCHTERLEQPLRWNKPRMIFVNSMSDLFHDDVPFEFIDQVFAVMALAKQHVFQVLTKRPVRMYKYLCDLHPGSARVLSIRQASVPFVALAGNPAWPIRFPLPNVWLGVSVEDQATADERIPLLLQTPAAVRFVSAEPLLAPVDIRDYLEFYVPNPPFQDKDAAFGLDWVICGGESGPRARPMHPQWVRSLRDQCASTGTPFLFKQWGEWVDCDNGHDINIQYDAAKNGGWLNTNGEFSDGSDGVDFFSGEVNVLRVGKKAAGRLLDGVLHDEYPQVML